MQTEEYDVALTDKFELLVVQINNDLTFNQHNGNICQFLATKKFFYIPFVIILKILKDIFLNFFYQ